MVSFSDTLFIILIHLFISEAERRYHHHDFFGVRDLLTVRQLFDARCHYGHKTGSQNIYMRPHIFGNRLGIDLLDLDQTHLLLGDALNFVAHVAFNGGLALFVNRNKETLPLVERVAQSIGEYSHCRDFKVGTFTNCVQTYHMENVRLPDVVIFITTHNNVFGQSVAVKEAALMDIPTVGIVDSNCDPRLIDYPIPGNDDSRVSIELYLALFKHAILTGRSAFQTLKQRELGVEKLRQSEPQRKLPAKDRPRQQKQVLKS